MPKPPEAPTDVLPTVGPGSGPGARGTAVAQGVALVAVTAVVLDAAAGVLPDDPIIGVVTPVRLVLGIGLVALVVGGCPPTRWRNPLNPAAAVLLLAAAAATVAAGQDWSGWRGVLTAVAAFVLAVGARRILSTGLAPFGLLALLGVALAGCIALQQAAAGTPTGFCRGAANSLDDVCGPGSLIRAVGTFANPNLLAAFLVLLLPLAALAVAGLPDRGSRTIGTTIVVIGYGAILLTGSRGGILAALGGAVAFVALYRPARRRLAPLVALLLGAIAVFAIAAGGSAGIRTDVWTAALRVLAAHPLGVGPGRAGALITAAMPNRETIQHAHNLWLNWAVDTGYLGLAAFLAITIGAGVLTVRATRDEPLAASALGAGLAGFAVMGIVDDPANSMRVSLAMWTVLGVLAGGAPLRPSRWAALLPKFGRGTSDTPSTDLPGSPARSPGGSSSNGAGPRPPREARHRVAPSRDERR